MKSFITILVFVVAVYAVPPQLDDQIAEESYDHEEYYPNFAFQKIFNDGKPFVVDKDPVTGTINFNTKKDVAVSQNNNNFVDEQRRPTDINQIAPSIHDFLNLPVKYSSDKSVYPLISSSYSNMKYQGNNKNFLSTNHAKNSSLPLTTMSTTSTPKYYTNTIFAKSTVESKPTSTPSITTRTSKLPTTKITTTPSTTVITTQTPSKPSSTSKYETKFKYQDSAMIRKKVNITVTSTPKPTKIAFPTYPKLNVIPLKSSTVPAFTTLPASKPTMSYVDSSKVRFPSSGTSTTSTTTQRSPQQSTTKKVTNLSDLFSLWSNDEYDEEDYEEKAPTTTTTKGTTKAPVINFSNPPKSMLPNGFGSSSTKLPSSTTFKVTNQPTSAVPTQTTLKITEIPKMNSTLSSSTLATQSTTSTTTIKPSEKPIDLSKKQEIVNASIILSQKLEPKHPEMIDFEPQRINQQQNPIEIIKSHELPSKTGPLKFPGVEEPSPLSTESAEILKTSDQFDDPQRVGPQFFPNLSPPSHPNPSRNDMIYGSRRPLPAPTPLDNTIASSEQNYVSFGGLGGAPVRNTFVIQPGQDSASFVLGSQSMVGNHEEAPQGSSGHFAGSVIQESYNPYENKRPGQVMADFRPPNKPQGFTKPQRPNGVRFPSLPSENEIVQSTTSDIIRGTINAQPLSAADNMSPIQMNTELKTPESNVVFKEENFQLNPPKQSLIPPGDGVFEAPQFFERPGPNPPYIYGRPTPQQQQTNRPNQRLDRRPVPPTFQRLPMNERPQGNRLPPRPQLQYRIDHIPMPTKIRPNNVDRVSEMLPNILPQFRPNVRQQQPKRPYVHQSGPYMQQPPTFIRRQPQGPPRPYPGEFNNNRRHYMANQQPFAQNLSPPQKYLDPNHPVFQRHISANSNPLIQGVDGEIPAQFNGNQGRNPFTEETNPPPFLRVDEFRNKEPPQPSFLDKDSGDEPKLEPVVTLQQLQAKRMKERREKQEAKVEMPKLKESVAEVPVTVEVVTGSTKPVYVVYPMKGQNEDKNDLSGLENGIVIASRGEQGVAPQVSTGHEYQNTPFSVVSHFEQEPILKNKDKDKEKKKGSNFPYALERPQVEIPNNHKPDPQIYNTGEQPQVISSTLTRVTTARPIAIAYTPSPRPIDPKGPLIYDSANHEVYSMPNIAAQVISDIRDEATEHNLFVDDYADNDRVRDTFQAPFYASINLPNRVTPTSVEGWAIITPAPSLQQHHQQQQQHKHYETNQIDRSDKNIEEQRLIDRAQSQPQIEVTTKKFDPDNFQPEFLSGFQPIYSSPTAPKPPALPTVSSRDTPKPSMEITTPRNPNLTHMKPSPTPKKPSNPFESLGAFFEALTRDYDTPEDEDYESTSRKS